MKSTPIITIQQVIMNSFQCQKKEKGKSGTEKTEGVGETALPEPWYHQITMRYLVALTMKVEYRKIELGKVMPKKRMFDSCI